MPSVTVAAATGALGLQLRRPVVVPVRTAASPADRARRLGARSRTRRGTGIDDVGEVDHLRARVGAGGSLLAAFSSLAEAGGPWADEAAAVVRRARAGSSLVGAIDAFGAAGEGPSLVADALAIAGATGGSQRAALEAVARTLRDRRSLRREIRALSSQAFASAVVVAVAPIAFAVIVASIDPRVRACFLHTLAGASCALGGLLLDVAGAWWMATLVRRVR